MLAIALYLVPTLSLFQLSTLFAEVTICMYSRLPEFENMGLIPSTSNGFLKWSWGLVSMPD